MYSINLSRVVFLSKIKENNLLILLSICINICGLALPIYTLQAYDRIITSQNISTFIILTTGAIVFILFDFAFRLLRDSLTSYYSNTNKHLEFLKAIHHFAQVKPEKLAKLSFTEKSEILDELSKTNEFIYQQLYVSLVDISFLFLFLLVISILSIKLGLVIILIISAFIAVSIFLNNSIINKHKKREKSDERRLAGIINLIHSSLVAKIYSNEMLLIQKQDVIDRKSVINTYQLSVFTSLLYNFTAFTSQIIIIATLIIGVEQIVQGYLSFGTLIATIIIAGRLTNPIREMLTLWFRISNFVSSHQRLIDFYNESTRPYVKGNLKLKYDYIFAMNDLCIKDRNKSYNKAINALTIKLNHGECLAITNIDNYHRGLFKKLLTGRITPEKGEINVLGNPLYKLTSEQYYQSVGYITIDDQYIEGNILENITGGRDISHDIIEELCQIFEIKHEILQLEDGFQTKLTSSKLSELSKNLRTKILLVRAYLYKPKLVIIDIEEDYINEQLYQTLFKFLKYIQSHTAIIIMTNDFNLTMLADFIYRADQCLFYHFDPDEISELGMV